MVAGEERGSEQGIPMDPAPPLPWLSSFAGTHRNVYFDSIPSWAQLSISLTHPGLVLGHDASFGRAGLESDAGKEKEET